MLHAAPARPDKAAPCMALALQTHASRRSGFAIRAYPSQRHTYAIPANGGPVQYIPEHRLSFALRGIPTALRSLAFRATGSPSQIYASQRQTLASHRTAPAHRATTPLYMGITSRRIPPRRHNTAASAPCTGKPYPPLRCGHYAASAPRRQATALRLEGITSRSQFVAQHRLSFAQQHHPLPWLCSPRLRSAPAIQSDAARRAAPALRSGSLHCTLIEATHALLRQL